MTNSTPDILEIETGAIVAAAGCGKTFEIVDAIKRYEGEKPILVLTHTNAGVVAIRSRLSRDGVRTGKVKIYTIDGWTTRLTTTFPKRSGIDPQALLVETPKEDYPAIRESAFGLCQSSAIDDVLQASYSRVIVDEYQDCSSLQHELIKEISLRIPTCILGDPLQSIFDFQSDALPDWDEEVCEHFNVAGELARPWRWINAGSEELGNWLLEVRKELIEGKPIDLSKSPDPVEWVRLDDGGEFLAQIRAASRQPQHQDSRVLIIGDSFEVQSRSRIARRIKAAVTVEAVELKELVVFSQNFDLSDENALATLLEFAADVMTGINPAAFVKRVDSLLAKRAKKPANNVEEIACEFVVKPTFERAASLLKGLGASKENRVFRRVLFGACVETLQRCCYGESPSIVENARRARDRFRFSGRSLPKRAVGSTLLLKGLEAEEVVILDADQLSSKNLYVALTRGSTRVTVCSRSHLLEPTP